MKNDAEMRPLTPREIQCLEKQECRCDDWSCVLVAEPFVADRYRRVEFSGDIRLGTAQGSVEPIKGNPVRCGIYDAQLHNCTVGASVLVRDVPGGLSNVDVSDGAIICNVFSLSCTGDSCFGNDVKVCVINETGGREVMISTALTAPVAYLRAFYRHNIMLQKRLDEMERAEAARHRGSRARVGSGARVINCGAVTDVEIADGARVEGSRRLTNGTVRGFVGAGVTASDFIVMDGARVDTCATLHGAFVGRASNVTLGFTVHSSLVFSNCHLENGEAAAVFAGPFVTSMHKSTLLISGLFSFFNAGSNTNQSNHLYKLGAMHQGTMARGSKTGSGSYVLWPAVIGPFTTVNGRHYSHPDTRQFPFSLLVNGETSRSLLIPAANVASVGLMHDVEKWPARMLPDAPAGLIDFHWLSPYTVQHLPAAIDALTAYDDSFGEDSIIFKGCIIPRASIPRAIDRYRLLLRLFAGGVLLRKIFALVATNPEATPGQLVEMLREAPRGTAGTGQWVDLAGLLAPVQALDLLIERVKTGEITDMQQLSGALEEIHDDYSALSWQWLCHRLPTLTAHFTDEPVEMSTATAEQIVEIVESARRAAIEIEKIFRNDAAKELDPARAALSFGVDAPHDTEGFHPVVRDDFDRVRGSLDSNRALSMLHRRVQAFTASARNVEAILK